MTDIASLLAEEAERLLAHRCVGIPRKRCICLARTMWIGWWR